MTEPVTPNKGFTVPNTGDLLDAWGGPNNTNFTNIDTALAGSQSIALTSGGTVTMTAAQAQFLATNLTGALSANSIFKVPNVGGFYLLNNASTGAYTVSCQTGAAGGATVTLLAGWNGVFTDGTSVYMVAQPASYGVPTIASGFGTAPSILANGTAAFQVTVGSGGSDHTGTLIMPTATNGWVCSVTDITTTAIDAVCKQVSTSASLIGVAQTNITNGAPIAWTAGDVLLFKCAPF